MIQQQNFFEILNTCSIRVHRSLSRSNKTLKKLGTSKLLTIHINVKDDLLKTILYEIPQFGIKHEHFSLKLGFHEDAAVSNLQRHIGDVSTISRRHFPNHLALCPRSVGNVFLSRSASSSFTGIPLF